MNKQILFLCCKNCATPKRHIGCHSTCEEYLADKKICDEQNANARKEKIKENALRTYKREALKRYKR